MVDNVNFAKLFRDCPNLLNAKFTRTDIDLIFVRAKKNGERRINYGMFMDALGMIAAQRYPGMVSPFFSFLYIFPEFSHDDIVFQTLEASMAKLVEAHIAKLPSVN